MSRIISTFVVCAFVSFVAINSPQAQDIEIVQSTLNSKQSQDSVIAAISKRRAKLDKVDVLVYYAYLRHFEKDRYDKLIAPTSDPTLPPSPPNSLVLWTGDPIGIAIGFQSFAFEDDQVFLTSTFFLNTKEQEQIASIGEVQATHHRTNKVEIKFLLKRLLEISEFNFVDSIDHRLEPRAQPSVQRFIIQPNLKTPVDSGTPH